MPDDSPIHSEGADPFDGLVLDDDFVRGGSYEPPARTRVAIAQYGGRQTSWRHGGGLHDQSRRAAAENSAPASGAKRTRPTAHKQLSASASSRLPLVVSLVVVAIAAFLMFR